MATRAEKIHDMLAAHHAKAEEAHTIAAEGETKGSSRHTFHKTMMEHHGSQKEEHLAQMEDCQKAERDQMAKRGNDLEPTAVSAIAPDNPRLRAVPRAGQPQIPIGTAVDISKIVGADDESMHTEELSLRK